MFLRETKLSFPGVHMSLKGLIIADIVGFNFPEELSWGACGKLAWLQVGAADILHMLFARHLGCEHFASYGSDFERVLEILEQEFGLNLLASPQALLKIL